MDRNEMITGIEQTWIFDELFTAVILKDARQDDVTTMKEFAPYAINNLKDFNYLMRIEAGHHQITRPKVSQAHSKVRNKHLFLSFTAELPKPINPKTTLFSFRVFDPTYYIRMAHADDQLPKIASNTGTSCKARLYRAEPSKKALEQAVAIDQSPTEDDTLGQLFADRVSVTCD